jgi:hypothetical protein
MRGKIRTAVVGKLPFAHGYAGRTRRPYLSLHQRLSNSIICSG